MVRHSKLVTPHLQEMNWHPGASGSSATNLNGVQKGSHNKKCNLQKNGRVLFSLQISEWNVPGSKRCCPQQTIWVGHDSMAPEMGAPSTSHPPIPRLASAKCCRQPQMLYVSRPEASEWHGPWSMLKFTIYIYIYYVDRNAQRYVSFWSPQIQILSVG